MEMRIRGLEDDEEAEDTEEDDDMVSSTANVVCCGCVWREHVIFSIFSLARSHSLAQQCWVRVG